MHRIRRADARNHRRKKVEESHIEHVRKPGECKSMIDELSPNGCTAWLKGMAGPDIYASRHFNFSVDVLYPPDLKAFRFPEGVQPS
jgi:hypothetical protein